MADDSFKLFMYDDLNYYSLAETLSYKKNSQKSELIRNKCARKRSARKLVIQEDISDDLSMVEENFNERDLRIQAGEMKPRKGGIEVSSDGMSDFDDAASRINFWKDINTKDDMYQGAIFVSNDNLVKG